MENQSKNKFIIGAIAAAVVAIIIAIFIFKSKTTEEPVAYERKRGGPCPGPTETFTMNNPYMRGVIEQGQKFKVITNYYDCNPPKNGDLVFYQMHKSMEPVVKIIRGKEGDKFSLSKDKKYNAWNLEVNGERVYSEIDKKQAYFFGGPVMPPLGRYLSNHKVISKGDVILLSSWPPGDIDSGIFGMFNLYDVVGKVEIIEGQANPNAQPEAAAPAPQEVKKPETKASAPKSSNKKSKAPAKPKK